MPKSVLVLLFHPALQKSRAHAALSQALVGLDGVRVHDLYQDYPDFCIDVDYEQALLVEHDVILFQHPVFWYSCPALMKEWIDVVLTHGFAYGHEGTALAGKHWLNVVTTDGGQKAYAGEGQGDETVEQLFIAFRRTAALCSMEFQKTQVYHGIRRMNDEDIAGIAQDYQRSIIAIVEAS